MTLSVGIDLASVQAVRDSIARFGERYLSRVYTERELRDCKGDPQRLAARFAAKEATIKTLGPQAEAVPWRCIGVVADRSDRPTIELSGEAAVLARRHGVAELQVSLTHEGPFAAAMVIAQRK